MKTFFVSAVSAIFALFASINTHANVIDTGVLSSIYYDSLGKVSFSWWGGGAYQVGLAPTTVHYLDGIEGQELDVVVLHEEDAVNFLVWGTDTNVLLPKVDAHGVAYDLLVTVWGGSAVVDGVSVPEGYSLVLDNPPSAWWLNLEFGQVLDRVDVEVVRIHSQVPEPATYASMMGIGLVGLAIWRHRKP